jgi:hypothetical protein
MLRMCEPIFSTGKCVVLDSGFCVAKGITALHNHGVYAGALIKKRKYWPKAVPGDAIDRYFRDKNVGDVAMLDAMTEAGPDGKPFRIFCFKEPDYVMKIMASWMTLEELEGANTRRDYKDRDGRSLQRLFTYRQPFGLHFRYRHQIDDHNNRRHAPISLERTWATKFWPDRNFAWYLAVSEVNAALADGHFRRNGIPLPSLEFRKALAKEMLENTVGINVDDTGLPRRSTRAPIRVPCAPVKQKHYFGRYNKSTKKFEITKQKYQKQRCSNRPECPKHTRIYCKCTLGLYLCNTCFVKHKLDVVLHE